MSSTIYISQKWMNKKYGQLGIYVKGGPNAMAVRKG
jgi:hypothetical protein